MILDLSVILPSYNEADNIVILINKILANIPTNLDAEIILVDDNSPDGTCQKVKDSFHDNGSVKTLLRTKDRGLANSIHAGIKIASGDKILVMDTDMTHDTELIPKLIHVSKMYIMVSGSRYCAGGDMEDKGHYYFSLIYNWIIRLLLNTQVQDNLGGFFIMNRKDILRLPLDNIFYGFGDYYFRLIHYVQRVGYNIVEIPTIYRLRHQGKSKTNNISILTLYTRSLLKFKYFITFTDPKNNKNNK